MNRATQIALACILLLGAHSHAAEGDDGRIDVLDNLGVRQFPYAQLPPPAEGEHASLLVVFDSVTLRPGDSSVLPTSKTRSHLYLCADELLVSGRVQLKLSTSLRKLVIAVRRLKFDEGAALILGPQDVDVTILSDFIDASTGDAHLDVVDELLHGTTDEIEGAKRAAATGAPDKVVRCWRAPIGGSESRVPAFDSCLRGRVYVRHTLSSADVDERPSDRPIRLHCESSEHSVDRLLDSSVMVAWKMADSKYCVDRARQFLADGRLSEAAAACDRGIRDVEIQSPVSPTSRSDLDDRRRKLEEIRASLPEVAVQRHDVTVGSTVRALPVYARKSENWAVLRCEPTDVAIRPETVRGDRKMGRIRLLSDPERVQIEVCVEHQVDPRAIGVLRKGRQGRDISAAPFDEFEISSATCEFRGGAVLAEVERAGQFASRVVLTCASSMSSLLVTELGKPSGVSLRVKYQLTGAATVRGDANWALSLCRTSDGPVRIADGRLRNDTDAEALIDYLMFENGEWTAGDLVSLPPKSTRDLPARTQGKTVTTVSSHSVLESSSLQRLLWTPQREEIIARVHVVNRIHSGVFRGTELPLDFVDVWVESQDGGKTVGVVGPYRLAPSGAYGSSVALTVLELRADMASVVVRGTAHFGRGQVIRSFVIREGPNDREVDILNASLRD